MKRFLFAIVALFIGIQLSYAQRTLEMQDETDPQEGFNMEGKGGVIIRCSKDLSIRSFVSNMDREVTLYKTSYDDENNEAYHCLIFTPGNRILTIKAETYYAFDISLRVEAGRMSRYRIYDSDKAATASFFNQHCKKGRSYYDICDYISAREEFVRASNWSEATSSNIAEANRLIANCDTLLYYRRLGFEAADCLDLDNAIEYLSVALKMNPLDHNISDKLDEVYSSQAERCEIYLEAGDYFFKNKEYSDAIEMYQKVEDRNCEETVTALRRRIDAQKLLQHRKNLDRYLGVDYGKTENKETILGLTYATYKKFNGGYFTLRANSSAFDWARSQYDLTKHAEVAMSFGWTIPVVTFQDKLLRGVWVQAGIGAVMVNRYNLSSNLTTNTTIDYDDNSNLNAYWRNQFKNELNVNSWEIDTPEKLETMQKSLEAFILQYNSDYPSNTIDTKDLLTSELGFAATPEIGLAVKVWHFAVRFMYQYRFSFDKEFNEVLGNNSIYVGLGFCW